MSHVNSPPEAQPGNKTPSVMRYDRVQTILDSEPTLKDYLGPKDQEVVKRNKEKHYYSRGVITVTNALHERGHDAHNAERAVVLGIAIDLLRDKPQKNGTAKVEKPKPEPKPKVESVEPKPKPEPKKAKPPAVKSAPKAKAAKTEPLAPPVPAPESAAVPPAAEQKPGYVYYIYGTALSLAVSLHKVLEIGDRLPGAESRLEAAAELIDKLKPLSNTGVPMPEDFDVALKNDKANPAACKA